MSIGVKVVERPIEQVSYVRATLKGLTHTLKHMALDLFLFYVMWEVMLVPMYFIVGIWGGERRIYASIKFFIYTMVGSLLMLVAIVYLGLAAADGGIIAFARM